MIALSRGFRRGFRLVFSVFSVFFVFFVFFVGARMYLDAKRLTWHET